MTPAFVGIDPGLTGGIAIYYPDNPTGSRVWAMPVKGKFVDGSEMWDILAGIFDELSPSTNIAIEHVTSRPRQAGVFNFGLNTGIIHGVLGAMGLPFQLVASSKWKPAMGLQRYPDEDYKANKERSRLVALKLFPHLQKELSLKKDDGKAEALLLAVYLAHQHSRKESK